MSLMETISKNEPLPRPSRHPDIDHQHHEQEASKDMSSAYLLESHVRRESFFVGGTYVGPESARVMRGQMYVEALIPTRPKQSLPLVLLHGGAQTAMNWITTPDGRPGWAEWFASRGWKVYIVDQPARGRSAWQPDFDGPQHTIPASTIEAIFTAPKNYKKWPQAALHTQWPGTGRMGDPIFDQYYASLVSSVDRSSSEKLMRIAGAALLDRIGAAILVGHSQGGLHTWLIGDARPDLVKAIIAIEPSGPPYKDIKSEHAGNTQDRHWGLSSEPLQYEPAVTQDAPLQFEQQPETPRSLACWLQGGTPRRLAHISKIPVLVVTSQASYHALFDHFTVRYLLQAGVKAQHIRLEEHGIYGNGHMMMLEKNNIEIAETIEAWIVSGAIVHE